MSLHHSVHDRDAATPERQARDGQAEKAWRRRPDVAMNTEHRSRWYIVVTRGWESATLITTMSEAQIVVFTDGASKGNPGPGGWGVIIVTPDGHVTERGGGAATTTNNKMELTGAIGALSSLEGTTGRVSIYTDSTYVIQGIREWMTTGSGAAGRPRPAET